MPLLRNGIKLMRPTHWLKNAMVGLALFFGGRFDWESILLVLAGMAAFSALSSAVYIFNDICDAPGDALHEVKKMRPIASGAVSVWVGAVLSVVLFLAAVLVDILFFARWQTLALLVGYAGLNIFYSIKGKHVPLLDVLILSGGFMIRMFYGALLLDISISNWLYLTTLSISLYMALGKRRNELKKYGEEAGSVRKVLASYNAGFLDKNMYVFLTLTVLFYALWTMHMYDLGGHGAYAIWTTPLVIVIIMRYSLLTETRIFADPVEILLKDKPLLLMAVAYAVIMGIIVF
ncbi:MAG: UbiA prenyltransferase family protein [Defluviitaleaceae bacterium]|nr:UbiA prenyltransferase family protein [Defluviitaleaceae bacterium]MCL2239324.1 UbiA prenyltransferase family protein [Defluviitaleaceae bacterium]